MIEYELYIEGLNGEDPEVLYQEEQAYAEAIENGEVVDDIHPAPFVPLHDDGLPW